VLVIVARIAGRAGTVSAKPCDNSGTWLIALRGEHDQSTALQLDRTRWIWPFCGAIIVDLSEADFIDSSVIRWLLKLERELKGAGAQCLGIVVGPSSAPAASLFSLMRIPHVLACYETREEALSHVRLA
jgi:anti-anti-sigma regulatory factor